MVIFTEDSTILNGQICTDNSNIKLTINIILAQPMQWTFMFSGDVYAVVYNFQIIASLNDRMQPSW